MIKFFRENRKIFIFLFIILLFISCFRVLPIYFIEKIIDIANTNINQENIYGIIKIGLFFIGTNCVGILSFRTSA